MWERWSRPSRVGTVRGRNGDGGLAARTNNFYGRLIRELWEPVVLAGEVVVLI